MRSPRPPTAGARASVAATGTFAAGPMQITHLTIAGPGFHWTQPCADVYGRRFAAAVNAWAVRLDIR